MAVLRTLPLGGERTVLERSGPSGSATGTLGGEWQCDRDAGGRVAVRLTLPLGGERTGRSSVHCHSMSSVPCWNARGRVAVRLTLPLGGERTRQSPVHCHSMSSVPHWNARGRVAVRPERWGASGSASHTATRGRAYRAARRTLPLDAERTVLERWGASGSASHTATRG